MPCIDPGLLNGQKLIVHGRDLKESGVLLLHLLYTEVLSPSLTSRLLAEPPLPVVFPDVVCVGRE